jgi:hypothetical protein
MQKKGIWVVSSILIVSLLSMGIAMPSLLSTEILPFSLIVVLLCTFLGFVASLVMFLVKHI